MFIKYKRFNYLISILLFLMSFSVQANYVLSGVWENYSLGSSGTWDLSYETRPPLDELKKTSAGLNILPEAWMWFGSERLEIDLHGDFFGNGVEPAPLVFYGNKKNEGIEFNLVLSRHYQFGDVEADLESNGDFNITATPLFDNIDAFILNGILTPENFTFTHSFEYSNGTQTYGAILTAVNIEIEYRDAYVPTPFSIDTYVPIPPSILLFMSAISGLLLRSRFKEPLIKSNYF